MCVCINTRASLTTSAAAGRVGVTLTAAPLGPALPSHLKSLVRGLLTLPEVPGTCAPCDGPQPDSRVTSFLCLQDADSPGSCCSMPRLEKYRRSESCVLIGSSGSKASSSCAP